MRRITIICLSDNQFAFEAEYDGKLVASRTILSEAEVDDWIIAQSHGTEYTVALVMDYMVGRW
jgi:hypothetical protein